MQSDKLLCRTEAFRCPGSGKLAMRKTVLARVTEHLDPLKWPVGNAFNFDQDIDQKIADQR